MPSATVAASNADAIDPKLWTDLANERQAFDERRVNSAGRFRWFADFGVRDVSPALDRPFSGKEIPSGTDIPHSKDWFASDNFQQAGAAGEFAVLPIGNNVLTAILPRSRSTYLVSNKHGGTLRSPNFTLDLASQGSGSAAPISTAASAPK